MTLENLLKDVHRAAEQKARIDTCVESWARRILVTSVVS